MPMQARGLFFVLPLWLGLWLGFWLGFAADGGWAMETLQFRHRGVERSETGQRLLDADDAFALQTRDGQIFAIDSKEVLAQKKDAEPFTPFTQAEMRTYLEKSFPPEEGFHFLDNTQHEPFIVVYTTSKAFAHWYSRLLKKLYTQYVRYWKEKGIELTEPAFPLVAVVLSNEERFREYARKEGVGISKHVTAYYSKITNRIVMYDVTGKQVLKEGDSKRAAAADIAAFLKQPGAAANIATVIHEAVHQVSFNTGMHDRLAPVPVWFSEGLALFHEVPDTKNKDVGWTLGPHVNTERLTQLRKFLQQNSDKPVDKPVGKLIQKMIAESGDKLFADPRTDLDYYALAWGTFSYLAKKRPDDFAKYAALLRKKTPESPDTDAVRLADFESCFGKDWDTLHKGLNHYWKTR